MESLQSIITKVTDEYVSYLTLGQNNWCDIEKELLHRLQIAIATENERLKYYGSSSYRLPSYSMPKRLNELQLAKIFNACLLIRNVYDNPASDTSTVCIFDGEIYTSNYAMLHKAGLEMDHKFTNTKLNNVITMLSLICPKAYKTNRENLIAIKNGIYNTATKILIPYHDVWDNPDKYVFLSKTNDVYDFATKKLILYESVNPDEYEHLCRVNDTSLDYY